MLINPLISFDAITLDELNACLSAWGHQMGPFHRPDVGAARFHGLRHDGRLVAVVAADALVTPAVAGLSRAEAIELARVCAERPDLCRVALRLWREFVFPPICAARGCAWALSYQDAALHTGNLYRFDGWVQVGRSSSGTDPRRGKKGRRKVIWGWHSDADQRRARAMGAAA